MITGKTLLGVKLAKRGTNMGVCKFSLPLFAVMVGIALGSRAEEITGTRDLAGESVSWTSLTGSGTLSNSSGTLSVVTLTGPEDATFDGTITGNIRLVKTGSGVQTISRENKGYTGGTYVEGGTLSVPSLDYLGTKGGMGDLTTMGRIIYVKNGATVRVTAAGTRNAPSYMSQGLCVPPGESGVLEFPNWITKDGTILMTNATLTVTGGGGMSLSAWRSDANARNGRLVLADVTLTSNDGGAFGGGVIGFVMEMREGGVLEMPSNGKALPNIVMAGGRIEGKGAAGNTAGTLETLQEGSYSFDFCLAGTLSVEPSASPSVIKAHQIGIKRDDGSILDIAVPNGTELDLVGTILPSSASDAKWFTKSGGGVLSLDGYCAMSGLEVREGTFALSARTSFSDDFTLSPSDGATIRLADGSDTAMGMPLPDGLVASADVWVDATRISASDGTSVASVANLGSAGGVFSKHGTYAAPTLAADGIGGKPALAFDGSQVLMFNGYTNKMNTLTTFVVMQPSAHVKWSSPFSLCSVNPGVSGGEEAVAGSFFYSFNGDTISTVKAARGNVNGNTTSWAFEYSLSSYGLDMPLLLQHCRNGATGTGTAYYGEAYDASVKTNSTNWKQQNIERVCLGARMYATGEPYNNRFLNGRIGELIVFTRALSPAEYAYVETYLKNKWFGTAKEQAYLPQAENRPRVNVEVADGALARFSPASTTGLTGGTFVKTGDGTLFSGDFRAAAALEAQAGTLALQTTNVAARAAIWIDPSDDDTVTVANGIVTAVENKGTLGGSFTKNLGSGATLLSGGSGINGNKVLSFNKDGTLIYTGFVREDASVPRSLHVYAIVSRRSFTKFTSPFSFAHTGDSGNDKVANANFHYEEHDVNGGAYRTFYGKDATGLTNGTMSAGTYFCDLPRRDADGDAYISVNHMGPDWQLSATELAADDPAAVPWYATWNCTLSPLHVNRVQLGASMHKGGVSAGEGGYETALLAYLRKKWLDKGTGSTTPPACLTGAGKATMLHDRLSLEVGSAATLRHASAPSAVGTLALRGADVERAPVTSGGAGFSLFTVTGDVVLDGALSLTADAFPSDDVPLLSYAGTLTDSATWTLTGQGAGLFTISADTVGKIYWLKYPKGTMVIFR